MRRRELWGAGVWRGAHRRVCGEAQGTATEEPRWRLVVACRCRTTCEREEWEAGDLTVVAGF